MDISSESSVGFVLGGRGANHLIRAIQEVFTIVNIATMVPGFAKLTQQPFILCLGHQN
jgi:hypothetical protein